MISPDRSIDRILNIASALFVTYRPDLGIERRFVHKIASCTENISHRSYSLLHPCFFGASLHRTTNLAATKRIAHATNRAGKTAFTLLRQIQVEAL
jgi:hypothetical protein